MRTREWKRGLLATGFVGSVLVACGGQLGAGSASSLAGVLGNAACPELRGGAMNATFEEDARANATIRAFVTAAGDLADAAGRVEVSVGVACTRIADDLGIPDDARAAHGDESKVAAVCIAVASRMETITRAGASAQVRADYTPPECRVNANAEATCKGQCNAHVDPGDVQATCAPGHLYGRCDGTCAGSCSATCNGECNGQCQGSSGAGGKCAGKCAGTCNGTCTGECKGHCNVDFKEPHCDVSGRAPSADGRCDASCKAHADLTAQCTEPRVKVTASVQAGEIPKLVASLERNLPALIEAQVAYGQRVAGDVDTLVRTGAELPNALGHVSARAGACLAAAANATVSAQASLRISVQASASVTARAGGQTR